MTGWILAALALWFVQLFLPAMFRIRDGSAAQRAFLTGNRDAPPQTPVMVGRMMRAQTNMLEALVIFLPLAVLAVAQGVDARMGAAVFVLARLAYVPAYGVGIPWLRTVVWAVGHVGLAMMVWAILA